MNSQLFSRQASERLSQLLTESSDRQVVIIQGARQVGKTTLVKSLLKSFTTVTEINLETDLRALDEIERTADFIDLTRWLERAYGFNDRYRRNDKVLCNIPIYTIKAGLDPRSHVRPIKLGIVGDPEKSFMPKIVLNVIAG